MIIDVSSKNASLRCWLRRNTLLEAYIIDTDQENVFVI